MVQDRRPVRGHKPKKRGWRRPAATVTAVVVAALTAAITQWTTGVFGATGDKALAWLTGGDPLVISGRRVAKLAPLPRAKGSTGKLDSSRFTIRQERTGNVNTCYLETVVPRAKDQVFPPEWGGSHETDQRSLEAWGVANQAGDPGTTTVQLAVSAKPGKTVIVDEASIAWTRRAPKPAVATKVRLEFGSGCGGHMDIRRFTTDLDDATGQWKPAKGEKTDFPYSVKSDDPEIFELTATTKACDCSWAAKLHWIEGGESGWTVIDSGAGPFHTMPVKGYPSLHLIFDGGKWRRG